MDTPGSVASKTLAENERETPFEHLAVRDVNDLEEYVDPRLSLSSRPSPHELEGGISDYVVRALHAEHRTQSHTHESEKLEGDEVAEKGRPASPSQEVFYVSILQQILLMSLRFDRESC